MVSNTKSLLPRMEARVSAAAPLYRRALYGFATCVVVTTLDIVVCARMFIWVSQRVVSPWILIAMVPLGLTLWHMCRFAARDARKALACDVETRDDGWREAA
jgi:hypothetical protein